MLQAFVAEVDGIVVGSSGSQLFAGLTRMSLEEQHRKYTSGCVYVEPLRARYAKKLTDKALEYLKSIGCTSCPTCLAIGKPVYSTLGFSETNEMRLDLI